MGSRAKIGRRVLLLLLVPCVLSGVAAAALLTRSGSPAGMYVLMAVVGAALGAALIGVGVAFAACVLWIFRAPAYSRKLADRYLRRPIIAIATGLAFMVVAAYIVVFSVTDGFRAYFEQSLRAFNAHIIVSAAGNRWFDWKAGAADVRETAQACQTVVQDVTPFVEGFAVLEGRRFNQYVQIRGVDLAAETRAAGWRSLLPPHVVKALDAGRDPWVLENGTPVESIDNPVLVGRFLAIPEEGTGPEFVFGEDLHITVVVQSGVVDQKHRREDLVRPVGAFESGNYLLDKKGVITSFESAQRIFGLASSASPSEEERNRATGISVWLADYAQAGRLKEALIQREGSALEKRARGLLGRIGDYERALAAGSGDLPAARPLAEALHDFRARIEEVLTETGALRTLGRADEVLPSAWRLRRVSPFAISQPLSDYERAATAAGRPTPDFTSVHRALTELRETPALKIESWQDRHPKFLDSLKMQSAFTRLFGVCFMALVSCFVAFMMWVIVREKERDIGILKALGAGTFSVVGVFLRNGLFIGVVGSAAGLAAGYLIQRNINTLAPLLGLDFIAGQLMDLPHNLFQTHFTWSEAARICGVTIGLSLAASLYPAYVAARVDPVETIRRER